MQKSDSPRRRALLCGVCALIWAGPGLAQRIERSANRRLSPDKVEMVAEARNDALSPPDALGLRDLTLARPAPPPSRRNGPPILLSGHSSDAARLLRALHRRGRAGGLTGVVYDNRDRGHSRLSVESFPQLASIRYDEALRAQGLDYGLNDHLRFSVPVIGNSSTALTSGAFWRSQTRQAMTRPGSMARVAALYGANHLYLHPEHNDHDPGRGDLFPANIPCILTSQGSSGSDQPFLGALMLALAAIPPKAQRRVFAEGQMGPVLQMLLRRGYAAALGVEYLDGAAHPVVFDAAHLRKMEMVRAAQRLTAQNIPVAPRLTLEAAQAPGDEIGLLGGADETLFHTPFAIAQVARAAGGRRRYVISAAPLPPGCRLRWVMLSGAAPVSISERGPRAAQIDIDLKRAFDGAQRRIDLGVFCECAGQFSAPSIFSLALPYHERRDYGAEGRLLSAVYDDAEDVSYVDPLVFPRRPWRDDYAYDAEGRLTGWRRSRAGGAPIDYTRHGARVERRDAEGRPSAARLVRYTQRRDGARVVVEEVETDMVLDYAYDGPQDALGRVSRPINGAAHGFRLAP